MKNRLKFISLLLVLLLSVSFLTACDINDILSTILGNTGAAEDDWKPTGADVTLVSKTQPMSYYIIFAPDSDEAKAAATLFKNTLAENNLPTVNSTYSSDFMNESKEILFGNTDRTVSKKAQELLDEKSKNTPNDYHWVFHYRDGKLAIVANSALAYEFAIESFFSTYAKFDAVTVNDTLKQHCSMTQAEYEEYLEELDRIAAEEKKAENAKLLLDLLPLVETQRIEFDSVKGKWNTYDEISASNPEIYLFKDYTADITTLLSASEKTKWDAPPADPIDEHPRLLLTSDKIPTIKKMLEENNATNAYFRALVDQTIANNALLPDPSYKGENPTVNNSIEHNYDDSILSAIQAKALAYLVYEDEYYGYQAIYYMKNFLKTLDIKIIPSDQCRSYGYVMYTAAIVYDWCYDLLTETDKIQFIAGVENVICRGSNSFAEKMEVGFPPTKQGAVNGHGAEYQILRDYLAFAVAIYGDNDSWWEYIGARTYSNYILASNYYYQSGITQQGTGYATARHIGNLFSGWIFLTGTGVNPYVGMENTVRSMLGYEYMPGYMFNDGDGTGDNKTTSSFSSLAFITAYLYGDSAMLAQAEHLLGEGRYGNGYSGLSATAYVVLRGLCELEAADDRHEGMDLIQYNGYPLGQYVVHQAWNDPNAASAVLRIKELTTANHEHCDSGTFEIYYKGMLTSDGGAYNNFGADHTRYFHQATIAHNGLIIFNNSLVTEDKGFYSGGQRTVAAIGIGNSLESWLEADIRTAYITGKQHAYLDEAETQPLYAYIAGNITEAYHDSTTNYVGRRMLSVFTGDKNYPMVLFVYDDVSSKNAAYEKRFLLQISSKDAPTIDTSDKTVITENGEGRLVLTCLSDNVTFNAVGGRVYDANGKYDCKNSLNYSINGKQLVPMNGTADDGHWGRVEIIYNKKATNATFMNVLYVTDKGNTKMASVRGTGSENGLTGGIFNKSIVALFATDRNRAKTEISCKTFGSESMSYYVSGVEAGEWTVSVDGKTIGTYSATDDGGLLTFTAPAGVIKLTPKK